MVSESSIIFDRVDFSSILNRIRTATTVGIQIPDGLKYYTSHISDFFRNAGFNVIVSGKPTYGACDIDLDLLSEVDYLLHFAHTKMVEMDRVIYIPYKVDYTIDTELLEKNIDERKISVIGTASYAWKFEEIKRDFEDAGFVVELKKGNGVEYPGQVLGCNYTCLRGLKSDAVIFIGDGDFHPIGAALITGKKVYAYSPLSSEFKTVNTSDFLKKRYLAISKAMNSEKFGIVVSSKIGQKRLELAFKLQKLAFERGKKAEIIFMDEITPSMLDNFRFETYVNTACPRLTFDDFTKFSGRMISPEEFEIVVGIRDIDDYGFNV